MIESAFEKRLENIQATLNDKSIYDLRQIGRAVGVHRPADMKKGELISQILKISKNEIDRVPPTTRGAPPKSHNYDQTVVNEINACRSYYAGESQPEYKTMEVASSLVKTNKKDIYEGVLVCVKGEFFLREQSEPFDLPVPSQTVLQYCLREGDIITCKAEADKIANAMRATAVLAVNGVHPEMAAARPRFEDFQAYYPNKQYLLDCGSNDNTLRVIDLFAPIGNGQRAIISAPPQTGKTTLLKKLANAFTENYKNLKVFVLLIGERPEDAADFKRSVNAEVICSTFDKGENDHIYAAALTVERAKRMVETGVDAVILLDSFTKLVKAYNACITSARTLSGGLDLTALNEPRKILSSARNTMSGALTIIATADVNTGDPLDDVIYNQLKSACNMQICLSSELAEKGIFPAIDVKNSGARKEELILSDKQIKAVNEIRSHIGKTLTYEKLLQEFENSKNNDNLCINIHEWLN